MLKDAITAIEKEPWFSSKERDALIRFIEAYDRPTMDANMEARLIRSKAGGGLVDLDAILNPLEEAAQEFSGRLPCSDMEMRLWGAVMKSLQAAGRIKE